MINLKLKMPKLPMTQAEYNGKPKYERGKSKEYQHLYSYRWAKYSKARLRKNPLCVECLKHNKTTAATVTDHIIPHKGSRHKFWDPKNHQSLCKYCHDRKTYKEGAFKNL